jgi:hypothetical protein
MGAILASAVGPRASAILDPIGRAGLSASTIDQTRAALAGGLTWIFGIMLVTSVLAWLLAIRFMPAVHVGHETEDPSDARQATKASVARPTTR